MQLHFEPDLEYQRQAVDAVADLFRGQEVGRTVFTVTRQAAGTAQGELALAESTLGIGNELRLLDDELLANLRDVQLRHGLRPADALASGDFTVEMETGTGKTYVYLRTVFELHRRYGFAKFVVVVPSVAIKEGVYKTLQVTAEHFRGLYANVPFDYFLYDSARLGEVRNFATSARLQVMVVTVGAINKKDVNNLYKDSEKTGGERPIDLIRATRPVVIVDEPQSVDGGLQGSGRKALAEMHPLCTLRYSATHADKHHMVYRLDAVDAYQRKLVKEIEVAAVELEGGHNAPYVRLESVGNARGVTAKLVLDVATASGGVTRKALTLKSNADLREATGRAVYDGYRLGALTAGPNASADVHGPGVEYTLAPGQARGGGDADVLKRAMIRRTVEEHFEKELALGTQGIKVLSLFFVDAVEHYRAYASDGTATPGKYAVMFEEEYRKAAARPRFAPLFAGRAPDPAPAHNGYFAVDRRVVTPFEERELKKSASRETVETDTYNLIMRDKERLLDPATPLRFIFSHSALREGWDNPNVFQICTLREIGTERERRQTIGRGLRICVDQHGVRRRGEVNRLTVVATESYQEFAEQLQQEIEADTGIRFGVVQRHDFAAVPVVGEGGVVTPLGVERSEALWQHFERAGYVDARGKVLDPLRLALRDDAVDLPPGFEAVRAPVTEILRKLTGKLEIRNANERRTISVRRAVLDGDDFRRLWDRVKHRTTYRVHFDNARLVRDCTEALRKAPAVAAARVQVRKAGLAIGRGGVEATELATALPTAYAEAEVVLPDVLSVLQDATQLTRRTVAEILVGSGRLDDFRRNPQHFLEVATEAITRTKQLALVDGIRYQRVGDDAYYAQELFAERELVGYLKNTVPSERSPYDYVVYDSETVERPFAEKLETNEAVRVYAKLPDWFKVPTPLGTYNPDWAVLVEVAGAERLYLVVETKGSVYEGDLRTAEGARIACGRAHFAALASAPRAVGERPAEYRVERSFDEMMADLVTTRA